MPPDVWDVESSGGKLDAGNRRCGRETLCESNSSSEEQRFSEGLAGASVGEQCGTEAGTAPLY